MGFSAEADHFHGANQSKIESNNVIETPNREFQHKNTNPNGRNAIKFTDLNFDVLFQIIIDLDVIDLFNLARSSAKLSLPVTELFRRRYKNYRIEISNTCSTCAEPFVLTQCANGEDRFYINDFQSAIGILTHFGHLISRLDVQNHKFNRNDSAAIIRCMNKYCVESLTQLNLDFIKCDTIEHLTAPLNNVEELSLIVEARRIKSGVLPLNQLFPTLKKLHLKLYSDLDYAFIYCNFSHLEHLSVAASNNVWDRKDHVEELLRKNPNIRSFNARDFPNDYAKVISKHLHQLENLTLHEFDAGNDSIHFEHVKKLNLYAAASSSIVNLSLPRLESMEMFYSSKLLTEWMEFFRNHQNLKQLKIYQMESNAEMSVLLAELTAELHDLVEVTMECRTRVRAQSIIKFIENHEKLMKFELLNLNFRRSSLNILENRFENEWHIYNSTPVFMMTSIVFERKLIQ